MASHKIYSLNTRVELIKAVYRICGDSSLKTQHGRGPGNPLLAALATQFWCRVGEIGLADDRSGIDDSGSLLCVIAMKARLQVSAPTGAPEPASPEWGFGDGVVTRKGLSCLESMTPHRPRPVPSGSGQLLSRRSVLQGAASAGAAGVAAAALVNAGLPAAAEAMAPAQASRAPAGRAPGSPSQWWCTFGTSSPARWTCSAAPPISAFATRKSRHGWFVPATDPACSPAIRGVTRP